MWVALAALQPAPAIARERPRTPEEVSAQRVAGSIEDRVRIDLETAGGELAAAEIEVAATPDGHVTLSGRVPSPEAKARAEQRARWAVGVTAVENRLEIVAPPTPPVAAVRAGPDRAGAAPDADPADRPSDRELAERVARAIANDLPIEARARHRWLRGWQVAGEGWAFEVDVNDGRVRLDGRVSDRLDVSDVTERARMVPSVRSVDSSLERTDPDRKGFLRRLF